MSTAALAASRPEHRSALYTFGVPWPDLNAGLSYTDVIKSSENETTLIDFYSCKYMSSAPFQGWLQRIRNGQITVDGVVVTNPQAVLSIGSKIIYHRLPWKEADAPYMLQVLYEDDEMFAVNKPLGLQVLPGGLFQQRTVLTQLQWKASKHGSNCFTCPVVQQSYPVPVHRLGRGTSGILLCAKTKWAKTTLASYFAEGTAVVGENKMTGQGSARVRRISKFYRALAKGILAQDEVFIEQPIGVMHYPGVANGLYVSSSLGKPALSKVQVLERDTWRNQTIVQVEIHSGRPHQIRIHLASIGHPLVGDPLYQGGGLPNFLKTVTTMDSFTEDGDSSITRRGVLAHQLKCFHVTLRSRVQVLEVACCKMQGATRSLQRLSQVIAVIICTLIGLFSVPMLTRYLEFPSCFFPPTLSESLTRVLLITQMDLPQVLLHMHLSLVRKRLSLSMVSFPLLLAKDLATKRMVE